VSLGLRTRRRLVIVAALVVSLVCVRWFVGQLLRASAKPSVRARSISRRFRDVAPRWSHDGTRIAFLRLHDSGHICLCVTPADLSRVCRLTNPELVNPDQPPATGRFGFAAPDAPSWSDDGSFLTFPRGAWFTSPAGDRLPGNAIWRFDLRGGHSDGLFVQADPYKGHALTYRSASLSADGHAAVAVARGPMDHSRVLVDVLGRRPHDESGELLDDRRDTDWPAWAPYGRRLAYAEGIVRGPHASRVAVLRLSEPGGRNAGRIVTVTAQEYTRLCPTDAARWIGKAVQPYITGVAWSLDGSELYFALTPDANDRSRYSIWRVAPQPRSERAMRTAGTPSLPVRVSPDDGWGYGAPIGLRSGLIGAVRYRDNVMEAVVLKPQPSAVGLQRPAAVRRICRLEADDWDFRREDGAIVTIGPASEDDRHTTLRARVWGRE